MDRTASAAHSGHDELLVARLFGGDVDATERAQALDLVADCPECASLFADLGAIADATAAMPVPPRPRDFTLTEADAARLRRKRHIWSPIFGSGRRRSLGSSLAALGLAGALLTGVASILGGTATSAPGMLAEQRAAAPIAAGATAAPAATAAGVDNGPVVAGAAPSGSTAVPALAPVAGGTSPAAAASDGGNPAALPPTESTATADHQVAVSSSEIAAAGDGNVTSGAKSTGTDGATQNGMDARLLWLGGFGTLFAIGLAILVLPRRIRRRG